jgi:endo-1,4-beta-xylanase
MTIQRSFCMKICKLLGLLVGCCSMGAADDSPGPSSLKAKYRDQFPIGVALGGNLPGDYSPGELKLIDDHFRVVTPENCMKMQHVQPAEGRFDFGQADALVAFAEARKLQIVGHTLVWAKDERTPAWVFLDGDRPADKEMVLRRLRAHIQTVAGRYRGKLASWDVVNEVIGDGDAFLRPSGWEKTSGLDFVVKAFEWAHEVVPDAVLIYNDYDVEKPQRREKLLRLLRELKARNVPIHAVGLQGHWEVDRVPFRDIEETLEAIRGLGLKAAISELDLGVVPRGVWWAEGGKNRAEVAKTDPLAGGCPPELLKRQADQYAELFRLFRKHSGTIARVTFWDLHDGRSWLNDFPWKHAEHPLLFDREGRPKPAFHAVMAVD